MDKLLSSPAFVIHMARNTERFDLFNENIKNAGFTDLRIFEAVDGSHPVSCADAKNLFNNPLFDIELTKGQIGCMLSHLKVLDWIVKQNIPMATIFEDDVHFHPDWKRLSELYLNMTPPDFDMLYIGNGLDSCRMTSDSLAITEITQESAWCTHAYVVTHAGAEKIVKSLLGWDYKNFNNGNRGKTLTGLYAIDIMLKVIQENCNQGLLSHQPFIWYSWNGTKYPCAFNKLPITGYDSRNTGLVFQNADKFKSLVSESNHDSFEASHFFYDENGLKIDPALYDTPNERILYKYITPTASVLEMGSKNCITSYHINKCLTNTQKHLIVEEDRNLLTATFRNLLNHTLNPQVFNGILAQTSLTDSTIQAKSLSDLSKDTGIKFDILFIHDNEYLEQFVNENNEHLANFKTIIARHSSQSSNILTLPNFIIINQDHYLIWQRINQRTQPHPHPQEMKRFLNRCKIHLPHNYLTLHGWCSLEKANKLIELVLTTKPNLVVELGVFGGRSLLPLALASKAINNNTIVIGIDAWSAEASTEGNNSETNNIWWSKINYDEMQESAKKLLTDNKVNAIVNLWKKKSIDAINYIADNSIDILHQDSNKSDEITMLEVNLYHTKIKPGGYWVFSDTNWETTKQAQCLLLSKNFVELYVAANNEWKIYRREK